MIDKFLEYIRIERRYSEYTLKAYEQDLSEFCSFLHVAPDAFDASLASQDDVRLWMVEMLDNGLTPRTVKRKLSALRSYYKYLLRIGLAEKDITRAVIAPKMEKPLPVFFKESDMKKVEEKMHYADDFESIRDNLVIEMLYQTGMRRAEILRLRDGDLDLHQCQIRIFGKRRKERIVPFGENLKTMISDYLALRNDKFELRPNADHPFFLNDKGLPISPYNIYTIVTTRMGEVSKQKRSPHVLRHTFATSMLNNGADINTIKTLMGHASLSATQVYTHTTFQQLNDAYKKAHPRAIKGKNKPEK